MKSQVQGNSKFLQLIWTFRIIWLMTWAFVGIYIFHVIEYAQIKWEPGEVMHWWIWWMETIALIAIVIPVLAIYLAYHDRTMYLYGPVLVVLLVMMGYFGGMLFLHLNAFMNGCTSSSICRPQCFPLTCPLNDDPSFQFWVVSSAYVAYIIMSMLYFWILATLRRNVQTRLAYLYAADEDRQPEPNALYSDGRDSDVTLTPSLMGNSIQTYSSVKPPPQSTLPPFLRTRTTGGINFK